MPNLFIKRISYRKSPEYNTLLIFICNIHLFLKLVNRMFQEEVVNGFDGV
jgi:hypothetical protein